MRTKHQKSKLWKCFPIFFVEKCYKLSRPENNPTSFNTALMQRPVLSWRYIDFFWKKSCLRNEAVFSLWLLVDNFWLFFSDSLFVIQDFSTTSPSKKYFWVRHWNYSPKDQVMDRAEFSAHAFGRSFYQALHWEKFKKVSSHWGT